MTPMILPICCDYDEISFIAVPARPTTSRLIWALALARSTVSSALAAPFDLAFLDPPYGKGLGEKALEQLAGGGWLRPDALVVFERARDEPDPAAPGFEGVDARDYGAARVHFLRFVDA